MTRTKARPKAKGAFVEDTSLYAARKADTLEVGTEIVHKSPVSVIL